MVNHSTDRRHLTTTAYADRTNLAVRQRIYSYQQPEHFGDWALAQTTWSGVDSVIDVGYTRRPS